MAIYELTTILPEGTTPAKLKSHKDDIAKLVKTLGGKVAESDELGEQRMAYPMKDKASGKSFNSGVYTRFGLELDEEKVATVNQKLRLNESLPRYLLVKSD